MTIQTTQTRQSRHRPASPPPASLNLTAMIDVVFLLLIFFLVTTTFVPGEGTLPATLAGDDRHVTPALPLRVSLASSGETGYAIDVSAHPTRPTSFGELSKTLAQLQHNPAAGRTGPYAPEDGVTIAPTGKARWQHVVNAYNAALRAGYTSIGFQWTEP